MAPRNDEQVAATPTDDRVGISRTRRHGQAVTGRELAGHHEAGVAREGAWRRDGDAQGAGNEPVGPGARGIDCDRRPDLQRAAAQPVAGPNAYDTVALLQEVVDLQVVGCNRPVLRHSGAQA